MLTRFVPLQLLIATVTLAMMSLTALGMAQTVPDGFYYKFDGGGASTPNFAVPGSGSNPAPVNGHTQGGTGQFGEALQGVGGISIVNFVDITSVVANWGTTSPFGDAEGAQRPKNLGRSEFPPWILRGVYPEWNRRAQNDTFKLGLTES